MAPNLNHSEKQTRQNKLGKNQTRKYKIGKTKLGKTNLGKTNSDKPISEKSKGALWKSWFHGKMRVYMVGAVCVGRCGCGGVKFGRTLARWVVNSRDII